MYNLLCVCLQSLVQVCGSRRPPLQPQLSGFPPGWPGLVRQRATGGRRQRRSQQRSSCHRWSVTRTHAAMHALSTSVICAPDCHVCCRASSLLSFFVVAVPWHWHQYTILVLPATRYQPCAALDASQRGVTGAPKGTPPPPTRYVHRRGATACCGAVVQCSKSHTVRGCGGNACPHANCATWLPIHIDHVPPCIHAVACACTLVGHAATHCMLQLARRPSTWLCPCVRELHQRPPAGERPPPSGSHAHAGHAAL